MSTGDDDTSIAFGEWRPDISDYDRAYTDEILNVLARADGYGPFPGFSALTSPIGGGFSSGFSSGFDSQFSSTQHICRGFFKAINTDGSTTNFAATANRLYKLNTTNFTWTDISKGGAAYPAVSNADNWQFAQTGNFVIAVQANIVPQVFDLTSSTNFADLGGSPPQARYIDIVGYFVVLTGLLNNPYRIQWSGLGLPTVWTPGTSSSSFQDLPDGGIVRGVAGGEYGNIFQDTTIRRLTYAPGNPVIFQIERITEDKGLFAPYSLIRSGDQIFWLAGQGFHKMQLSGYPQPIGKERVDRTITADLDANNLQLMIGASDPKNSRVIWAYKSAGSSVANYFDKMLIYDYAIDRFTPATISGEYIGSLAQPGLTLENLDTISSSIDALAASLDSFAVATNPQIAMFDTTSALGFLRGNNLEAQMSTGAQAKPGRRFFIRSLRPLTDAPSAFGSVGKRERLTDIETFTTEAAMDATGNCSQRASTRYARGRVRIPAGVVWTFATGVEPEVALEGER
jgi:hypothetical protein